MRILASQTLYRLVPLDPAYFIDRTLPDLVDFYATEPKNDGLTIRCVLDSFDDH